MLHSQRQVFLREIEHIEDGRLGASVLAMVDRPDHLDDGFTLMDDLLRPVLGNDSQLSLYQHAIIHHIMVMPSEFLTSGKHILHGHQFRAALWVIRKFRAIPTLRGADEFRGFYLHIHGNQSFISLLSPQVYCG